jgi:hypothetical protein
VVKDYRYTVTGYGGNFYSFTVNGNLYHVKERDFDACKNGKYVSFTDDMATAKKSVVTAYRTRLVKAESDVKRLTEIVKILKGEM